MQRLSDNQRDILLVWVNMMEFAHPNTFEKLCGEAIRFAANELDMTYQEAQSEWESEHDTEVVYVMQRYLYDVAVSGAY